MIHVLATLMLVIFPVMVIAAGLKDLTSYTIPNWISLTLIAGFGLAAATAGLPLAALSAHVGIGLIALVAGMALFALGWIGGGDAKLFAAAGLWLGWPAAGLYVLVTCIAGGALAVILLALRSAWIRSWAPSGPAWFARLSEPGERAPYGVAIAIGALVAFPTSALVSAH